MKIAVKEELIKTLKTRFEKNTRRHEGIDWKAVQAKLEANPGKLETLHEMEQTGGEPDVIGYDKKALVSHTATVHLKAQKADAAFATMAMLSTHEARTSQVVARSKWRPHWASKCSQKHNIENFKSLENSIPRHRAG